MIKSPPRVCRFWQRRLLALVLASAATGYAWAASATHGFRVSATLDPGASCERRVGSADGRSQVSLACGSGKPLVQGNPRFLLHVYRAGEWLGEIDADTGNGTITSWRVVRVANRDYLEIMVGW